MPPAGEVASHLGYLLRRASISTARLGDHLVERSDAAPDAGSEVGATFPSQLRELSILVLLERFGALSQHEVAGRLGINRSVMVKVVDSLERSGDLERERVASDRRSYWLVLTGSGRERSVGLYRRAEEVGVALTGSLAPAGRRRLVRLLGSLVASQAPEPYPAELLKLPAWLVCRAQEQMEAFGDRGLAGLGLSVRTFVALAISGPTRCTQTDLAGAMMIGPAAAVDLVDQAERMGALRRVRDPIDRRSHRLELTPEGTALLKRASAVVSALTGEFTAALSAAENAELVGLLQTLVEGAGTRPC